MLDIKKLKKSKKLVYFHNDSLKNRLYVIKILNKTKAAIRRFGAERVATFVDHNYVGPFSLSRGGSSFQYLGDEHKKEAVLFSKRDVKIAIRFIKRMYLGDRDESQVIAEEYKQ